MRHLVTRKVGSLWHLVQRGGHLVYSGPVMTGEVAPTEYRAFEITGLEGTNNTAGQLNVATALYNAFKNGTVSWGTPLVVPPFVWGTGSLTGYRQDVSVAASAYGIIPAWKFAVPSQYDGRTVTGVELDVYGVGAFKCALGYVTGQSREVDILRSTTSTSVPDDFYIRLSASASVVRPWEAANADHVSVNVRDLFTLTEEPLVWYYNTAKNIRSYLPISSSLITHTMYLPASAATIANENRYIWLIATPSFAYDDPSDWTYFSFNGPGWFATYSATNVRVRFRLDD